MPRYSIREWITAVFCVMSIKIANSIGCVKITAVFQIFLNRFFRCSMSFSWHYFLISDYWVFLLFYIINNFCKISIFEISTYIIKKYRWGKEKKIFHFDYSFEYFLLLKIYWNYCFTQIHKDLKISSKKRNHLKS